MPTWTATSSWPRGDGEAMLRPSPSGAGLSSAAAGSFGSRVISGVGAGWGVIDSAGRPKAAYWYLKRACAPIALLAVDEGLNGLWLHALNDTCEPIEAELRVTLYRGGLPAAADRCR